MGKKLVKQETGTEMKLSKTDAAISPVIDIAGLITAASEKGMSPETIQKFLDMRKQLKDEYAKEQYFLSLAKLQGELPTIEKEKEVVVDSKVVYRYAPIEKIVEKVQKLIADNGFSYSFKDRQDEKGLTVVCESHHVAGHTETHELTAASNVSGKMMNAVQGLGATKTYLKRYVFCDTYGIMTGDEDTDAVDTGTEKNATQPAAQSTTKVEDKSTSKRGDAPPFPKEEHKPSAEFALMLDRCRAMLNNLTADLPTEGKKLAFEDTCKAVFGVKKYYKPLDKFTLAELDKLYQRLNEDAAQGQTK